MSNEPTGGNAKEESPAVKLTPADMPQRVNVDLLRNNPDNDRTEYRAESLQDIAPSIMEHGILQNLEAGPDGTVYIGNRRLRATVDIVIPALEAKAAGGDPEAAAKLERAKNPPVKVLTEAEAGRAAERALIENLQREDLSAYEEAMGFQRLLEKKDEAGNPVHTPETLEASTGKSAVRIRQRVKVRFAPAFMLKALEDGIVGAVQCEMVGRIPSVADREDAAKRILEPRTLDRPLNKRETAALIREEYMVSLRGAPFDQSDKSLIPDVGDCKGCPFRSGNDKNLEGEFQTWEGRGKSGSGFSPDLCTNPACYRSKCDAAWQTIVSEAEAQGYGVLEPSAAEREFSGEGGALALGSPYIDLDGKPTPKHTGHFKETGLQKWRVILRPLLSADKVRIIKARNPVTGNVHELAKFSAVQDIIRAEAEAAKKGQAEGNPSAGKDLFGNDDFGGLSAAASEEADRKAKAKERAEKRAEMKVAIGGFDAMADAFTKDEKAGHLPMDALILTFEVVMNASADACGFMMLWLDMEKVSGASPRDYLPQMVDMVRGRVKANTYTALHMEAMIALAALAPGVKHHGVKSPDFARMAKLFNVDLSAIAKKATAEAKKEVDAEEAVKLAKNYAEGEAPAKLAGAYEKWLNAGGAGAIRFSDVETEVGLVDGELAAFSKSPAAKAIVTARKAASDAASKAAREAKAAKIANMGTTPPKSEKPAPAKKVTTKKAPAKKAPAKKVTTKKAPAKKVATKKATK